MTQRNTTTETSDLSVHAGHRQRLRERGVSFNEDTSFGVMLSVPSACAADPMTSPHTNCWSFCWGTPCRAWMSTHWHTA